MRNSNKTDIDEHRWQDSFINFVESVSNFVFYTCALFIILIPPLKWLGDVFPSTHNTWWVIASVIVFVIIIPALTPVVADYLLTYIEKTRKGEVLPVIFKPLKAFFAVTGILGVLELEYYVIHDKIDKPLIEVVYEFIKAL